jgi:hypothetical protein
MSTGAGAAGGALQGGNQFAQNIAQILLAAQQFKAQREQSQVDAELRARALELQELNAERNFGLEQERLSIAKSQLEMTKQNRALLDELRSRAIGMKFEETDPKVPLAGPQGDITTKGIPSVTDIRTAATKTDQTPKQKIDELDLLNAALSQGEASLAGDQGLDTFLALGAKDPRKARDDYLADLGARKNLLKNLRGSLTPLAKQIETKEKEREKEIEQETQERFRQFRETGMGFFRQ